MRKRLNLRIKDKMIAKATLPLLSWTQVLVDIGEGREDVVLVVGMEMGRWWGVVGEKSCGRGDDDVAVDDGG